MNNQPIGVMDSGAGGLTVAAALRRLYPEESIVYFGDSARNPYGERMKEEIAAFAEEIKEFLISRNVKAVIAACNTITFNTPASFYEGPVPVIGMSLDFSELPQVRKAAVFATPASIASHAHRRGLLAALPDAEIAEVPCDGLAHAIETCAGAEEIETLIRDLAGKYDAMDAEAAVFGCTHYPLVREIFEKVMPEMYFLDPAEKTVEAAMKKLDALDALADRRGEDHFYFSGGKASAERLLLQAFGTPIPAEEAGL